MGKKGLVWQVVSVAFLLVVIVLPVFATECSEWSWQYIGVTRESGNTQLHLRLISDSPQHGHSNTEWNRCFDCEDIVSVTYQTPSMGEPAEASYECDTDAEGVDFFKIEQTIEANESPTDFLITISGESAVGAQVYTLKWATNVCTGEVEWFNCEPPTAVKLSYFGARSLVFSLFERILGLFR